MMRVIRRHFAAQSPCRLYSRKQTSIASDRASAKGQKQTFPV